LSCHCHSISNLRYQTTRQRKEEKNYHSFSSVNQRSPQPSLFIFGTLPDTEADGI